MGTDPDARQRVITDVVARQAIGAGRHLNTLARLPLPGPVS